MRKIKSLMPIILLSIFLTAGMASAASLTPVGTCVSGSPQLVDLALTVDDGTGITDFNVTITGTGLTTTTADVSRGTITADSGKWLVFFPQAVTGGVTIVGGGSSESAIPGPGTLAIIRFTATDGKVDTETVTVTDNNGRLTPVAYAPVSCGIVCSSWPDVTDKYTAYTTPGSGVSWNDVIGCYNKYLSTP